MIIKEKKEKPVTWWATVEKIVFLVFSVQFFFSGQERDEQLPKKKIMNDKDRGSPSLVESSLKSLLDQPSIFPLIGKSASKKKYKKKPLIFYTKNQ